MSVVYLNKTVNLGKVFDDLQKVIAIKLEASKYGVTVDVEEVRRNRTNEQNRYLWAIYKHIVEFFNETGFIPDNLDVRYINSDFLHAYFKARFDLKRTHDLSTAEFGKYVDKVQNLMVEQSHGEYAPIYPDNYEIME